MKTTHEIFAAETLASRAADRGDHVTAMHLWYHVAACWQAKADRASRYGETAISGMFANEVRRAQHRADTQFNWIACGDAA